ncbi:MAG: hypothetical protein ACTSVI_04300 [Promethearchaeota archaeon]
MSSKVHSINLIRKAFILEGNRLSIDILDSGLFKVQHSWKMTNKVLWSETFSSLDVDIIFKNMLNHIEPFRRRNRVLKSPRFQNVIRRRIQIQVNKVVNNPKVREYLSKLNKEKHNSRKREENLGENKIDNERKSLMLDSTKISQEKPKVKPVKEEIESSQKGHQVEKSRFGSVKERIDYLLARARVPTCLPSNENKTLKSMSWNWDIQEDCDSPAVYVCHHCHKPLCSKHSYWIPDMEFPIIRRSKEIRTSAPDNAKIARGERLIKSGKGMKNTGLAFLLFGFITTIAFFMLGIYFLFLLFIGIGLLVFGGILIGVGSGKIKRGNKLMGAKIWLVATYPRYVKKVNTKYNKLISSFYQHMGYYLAVHCWDCLKTHHPHYYKAANDIIEYVLDKIGSLRGFDNAEPINDDEKTEVALFAANHYFSLFKFGAKTGMSINNAWPVRLIKRNLNESSSTRGKSGLISGDNITPTWFFADRRDGKQLLEKEDFIKQFILPIAERYNEKYIK